MRKNRSIIQKKNIILIYTNILFPNFLYSFKINNLDNVVIVI